MTASGSEGSFGSACAVSYLIAQNTRIDAMTKPFHPTQWPAGFDPDDPLILMQAALVDRHGELSRPPLLHSHATGQLVVSIRGVVGLASTEWRTALPPACALWAPPGLLHEGFIGSNSESLYLHIAPEWAQSLPDEPIRIMLSPMVLAMIRHFTQIRAPFSAESHTGRLARVLLEEIQLAPRLPLNFAPLPYNAKLFCIAEEIVANPTLHRTVDEWSSFIYMSARNFSRLVSRETGMSFGQWRLRLMMLTATRRLLEGETSEQVAEALGYETASAFIAAFKRIFGMTPGQYRSSTLAPYNAIALN